MRWWFGDLKDTISVGSAQFPMWKKPKTTTTKERQTNKTPNKTNPTQITQTVSHNPRPWHKEKGAVGTGRDVSPLSAAEIPLPRDMPCVQSDSPAPTTRRVGQHTSKYNICWLQNCFLFFPLVLPFGHKQKNISGRKTWAATVSK